MRETSSSELRELATDIEIELERLRHLETSIQQVRSAIRSESAEAAFLYESLALKLHNFYTGCERIFRLVASELNGAAPTGYDWHKRLLDRMSVAREERPALLTLETTRQLEEYLAFRHIVRNTYGFELDSKRVDVLAGNYPAVWHSFEALLVTFVTWLRELADQMEEGN